MLYKLRIRVVMQNRYLVIVLGVRLLWYGSCGVQSHALITLLIRQMDLVIDGQWCVCVRVS